MASSTTSYAAINVSAAVRSEIENYRLMTSEEKETVLRCIDGYSGNSAQKSKYLAQERLKQSPDWKLSEKVLDPSLRLCLCNAATDKMQQVMSVIDTCPGYPTGRGEQVLKELIQMNVEKYAL